MIVIWIAAIVVFGIVEAVTVGLVSIWFVLGAVAGLLAAVLGAKLRVLKTPENFNNDIGVPKTLLRLNAEHDIAVVEMGAWCWTCLAGSCCSCLPQACLQRRRRPPHASRKRPPPCRSRPFSMHWQPVTPFMGCSPPSL